MVNLIFEFELLAILILKGKMIFVSWYKYSFMFGIYEMTCFTLEQSWEILTTYLQNGGVFYSKWQENYETNSMGKEIPSTWFVKRVHEIRW